MRSEAVEAYSGYTYGESPRFVSWGGERLEVVKILARWRIPGGRGWRVEVNDGRLFELSYFERDDDWTIRII
jgi:hypothetical protein